MNKSWLATVSTLTALPVVLALLIGAEPGKVARCLLFICVTWIAVVLYENMSTGDLPEGFLASFPIVFRDIVVPTVLLGLLYLQVSWLAPQQAGTSITQYMSVGAALVVCLVVCGFHYDESFEEK